MQEGLRNFTRYTYWCYAKKHTVDNISPLHVATSHKLGCLNWEGDGNCLLKRLLVDITKVVGVDISSLGLLIREVAEVDCRGDVAT